MNKKPNNSLTLDVIRIIINKRKVEIDSLPGYPFTFTKESISNLLTGLLTEMEDECRKAANL